MHTIAFAILAAGLFASSACAGVATLAASADNTLYEDEAGILSNGQGESFFAGRTALEVLRRGLIRFDFSAIPAGSTITNVSLTLHCTRSISLAENMTLHRALQSWGEGASNALGEGGRGVTAEAGDATWIHRFSGGQTWTTIGGDFDATASATTPVAGIGSYVWTSQLLATDVQGWIDNPSSNNGWFLLGAEDLVASAKRFASRENSDELLRPSLNIEYVVPAPGVVTLFAFIAVSACKRRRSGG
jgi:hypothetical protein